VGARLGRLQQVSGALTGCACAPRVTDDATQKVFWTVTASLT
jgi:hypothetical protein